MNEAKLSNDELIRRLNELREVIINDDLSKIAREDIEIQDLLYENNNANKTKITKELNNWLGNQPLVISFQTSAPMRRLVVTQHAVELSWLFIQLRELYRDRIDYISKYDFYGELAQKAIDIVKETDDKCSNRELLFEVLRTSKIYI